MKKLILAFGILLSITSVHAAPENGHFEGMLERQIQNMEMLHEKISSDENLDEEAKESCIENIKTQVKWLKNQERPFDKKAISKFVSREQKNNRKCIERIQSSRVDRLERKIERLKEMIEVLREDGKSVEELEMILKKAESKLPLLQK